MNTVAFEEMTNAQLVSQFNLGRDFYDRNVASDSVSLADKLLAFNTARSAQQELAARGIEIN